MQLNNLIKGLLLSSVCFTGISILGDPATKGTKTMTNPPSIAKIAVVDIRQMLTQDPQLLKETGSISHEWRDLYNALQETLKPINAEISKLQTQYQTKIKELEELQKSGVSTKDALQKKYSEEVAPLEYRLQGQSQQIQNFSYNELNKIQNLVGPKIQKATDDVVKRDGWDFAINRDVIISTLSSGSRFNITSHVLSIINDQYDKDKTAAAAKKKAAPKAA